MSLTAPKIEIGGPRRDLRSLLFDARVRGWITQAIALMLIVYFFYFIGSNASANMAKLGISSGFGFLRQAAGFDVSMTLINYEMSDTHLRVFLVGALNTLLVSVLGILAATVLGVVLGIGRLSNNWLLAKFSLVYIEVFRNLPLLFQILFWYGLVLLWPKVRSSLSFGDAIFINNRGIEVPRMIFENGSGVVGGVLLLGIICTAFMRAWARKQHEATGRKFPVGLVGTVLIVILPLAIAALLDWPWTFEFPVLKGFNYKGGISITTGLIALWFSLTVYTAAFIAENVRSGISAVARGQTEAALSLGLSSGLTMRMVILPQALRVIVPPLISQYLNLIKNSSLAVAIGYPDLVNVFSGTSLNQTGQSIEIILITMSFYLSISLTISMAMNVYNKRVALKGGVGR